MLKQHLQFKLSQKLSPQQIQLMKLIQLPTQAFEQRLKQELEENPALESGKAESDAMDDVYEDTYDDSSDNETISAEDINIDDYLSDDEIPDYRTRTNNYSSDDEEKSIPYAAGTSFNQHLINQLNTVYLDDEEWAMRSSWWEVWMKAGILDVPLPILWMIWLLRKTSMWTRKRFNPCLKWSKSWTLRGWAQDRWTSA